MANDLTPVEFEALQVAWRDAGLSTRCAAALAYEGIKNAAELALLSEVHLLRIPNFGRVCLAEVRAFLAVRGYERPKFTKGSDLTNAELIAELARRLSRKVSRKGRPT